MQYNNVFTSGIGFGGVRCFLSTHHSLGNWLDGDMMLVVPPMMMVMLS